LEAAHGFGTEFPKVRQQVDHVNSGDLLEGMKSLPVST
jgi:hypothetical protein